MSTLFATYATSMLKAMRAETLEAIATCALGLRECESGSIISAPLMDLMRQQTSLLELIDGELAGRPTKEAGA